MGDEQRTFKAVGAGGVEWEFDVPPAGSFAEDRYRDQIAKGELAVIGDDPFATVAAPGPVTGSEQVEGGAPVPPVIAGTEQIGEAPQPPENVVPPEKAEQLVEHVETKIDETGAAMTSGDPSSGYVEVPDGNIDEVLAWVGDDKDRAVAALAAEQDKGENARSTLTLKLESLLSA